jgi:F0F1-type ATP synthase assembly protein I
VPEKTPNIRKVAIWMSFGIEIALMMLIPVMVGRWADEQWGTRPWGIIGGAFFGFVGFLWTLYKKTIGDN